ncbi:NAD-dependent epimerase/dehydratase family protein [Paraeggerthella hongkongensis]|nr:NAD-dependent epimerase/dehydratase family protein [Paraeggerthella hongkongensis]
MRVLLLGGTGAIGRNLAKILSSMGCETVVTSRQKRISNNDDIAYVQGNAKDIGFLNDILGQNWDAIVDFMVWSTDEFSGIADRFLGSTDQYVFISTYRVYDHSPLITEDCPRLLDSTNDREFLATDDYALAKARCENILFSSPKRGWTIIRPSIVYDGSGRFDLGVLASGVWLWRAQHHITIPFPEEMLHKETTMTWGGDVARMIARILGKSESLGEVYTAATSSCISWKEVAAAYQEVIPFLLKLYPLDIFERAKGDLYQIRYDRMFDRVVDNSKIMRATGLVQDDLVNPKEGLRHAVREYLESGVELRPRVGENARMDRLVGGMPSLSPLIDSKAGASQVVRYLARRSSLLDSL